MTDTVRVIAQADNSHPSAKLKVGEGVGERCVHSEAVRSARRPHLGRGTSLRRRRP